MTSLFLQFLYALFATFGFCIIFKVPLKRIPVCMLVGALCWSCYQICIYYDVSAVISCFIASCLAGLLSDICSRIFKEAATIFTIPGMICLVPGSNIYYTMDALLQNDMSSTAQIGTQTLLLAGSIASGLLTIGAVIQVLRSIFRKTVAFKDKF